jgi:ribonuclease E
VQLDYMAKKMLIDATHAEETRVVLVDGNKVEEFDFESENKRQLAGNIYLAKVTRVEPSLQAAFVDYGGNRHGFLAFSEIHPDYYQIPIADREALMAEERAHAEAMRAKDDEEPKPVRSRRRRSRRKSDDPQDGSEAIAGMETIDLGGDDEPSEPVYLDKEVTAKRSRPISKTPDDAGDDAADVLPEIETPAASIQDGSSASEQAKISDVDVLSTSENSTADDGVATIDPEDSTATPIAKKNATTPAVEQSVATPAVEESVAPVAVQDDVESVEDAADDPADDALGQDAKRTADGETGTESENQDTQTPPKGSTPIAMATESDDPVITSDDPQMTAVGLDETPSSTESSDAVTVQNTTDTPDPVSEDDQDRQSLQKPAPAVSKPEIAAEEPEAKSEPQGDVSASDGDVQSPDTVSDATSETAPQEDPKPTRRTSSKSSSRNRSRSRGKSAEKEEDVAPQDTIDDDDGIEDVANTDDEEDIRPIRKPRVRRYKIQEVVKVRQIMLVQVVKEERGNKGAALTTYLSLAGRYCVLMPNTARGGGISRKITNAVDRKKLKEIATGIDVPDGAGLIIRTAGANRTKTEIKRDYEYLQRLWEQIRELTLRSIAPAKIYEEGDLIKRSIRDLYNREIDEVLVEGERGYRVAKDFMKMIMPSHAKNVKHYAESMPLFARFQVESYLGAMFNPVVQLRSGGYIVIGVTEALVAVDVNSGRATKEASIEDTALKTNLEAAEEVARQLRLRDLAGLIVIDFIDMEERKNNSAVEKRLKDKLKTDRARIQVGRISGFGLMEMSRQRLRPGMIEASTQPCPHCHGTGLIRSDDSLALTILRQIEEEGTRRRAREVLVRCPVGISNYIMNQKREHVALIEARYGLAVRIEGDPSLVSPDFTLEKFKTATRSVPEVQVPVVSVDSSLMDKVDEEVEEVEDDAEAETEGTANVTEVDAEESEDGEAKPKRKRRRRRRRKVGGETDAEADTDTNVDDSPPAEPKEASADEEDETGDKKSRRRRRRRGGSRDEGADASADAGASDDDAKTAPSEDHAETSGPDAKALPEADLAPDLAPVVASDVKVDVDVADAPAADVASGEGATSVENAAPDQDATPEVLAVVNNAEVVTDTDPTPMAETNEPSKPKRRGWWSMGR